MTRLFPAIALVLHLSGLSAIAAVVCVQPGMSATSCCCHHSGAGGRRQTASPSCPCTMAPDVPAPVAPVPATQVSASSGSLTACLVALPVAACTLRAGRFAVAASVAFDTSPPYLTAAHPRC